MTVSDRRIHYIMETHPEQIAYRLEVSQEPVRARMCGFGDKDRRPIDPPPVVRLIVTSTDGTPISESSIDHSMMIVHAGLWSEDCTEERSLVINPSTIPTQSAGPSSTVMSLNTPSSTRNLMGHCTSSAYVLNDHCWWSQRVSLRIGILIPCLAKALESAGALYTSAATLPRVLVNPLRDLL
ncbi:4558_t:CDS:2, partial [Gigaspora rosea]